MASSFFVIGLNHTTAPIALREQWAYSPTELIPALQGIQRELNVYAVLLSTCNRTELYYAFDTDNPLSSVSLEHHQERVLNALIQTKHLSSSIRALKKHIYHYADDIAVNHLYSVACGLNSMVLGETQILGQLKRAVHTAKDAKTMGGSLHYVFEHAFSTAKHVRTQTNIGASSVSLAAASVRLSQKIFGDLSQRHILMIGAGEMIKLCATHYLSQSPAHLTIANRSFDKAQALIESLQLNNNNNDNNNKNTIHINAINLADVPDVLYQYDIIISCTASSLPIIGLGLVKRSLAHKARLKKTKTTMLVDLAVPRDIEVEVNELSDVYLYTVDDLGIIVQQGRDNRHHAVIEAQRLIDESVVQYVQWCVSKRAIPVIKTIQQEVDSLRNNTLNTTLKTIKDINNINNLNNSNNINNDYINELLTVLSKQLTQKLLHPVLLFTQQLAKNPNVSDDVLKLIETAYQQRR